VNDLCCGQLHTAAHEAEVASAAATESHTITVSAKRGAAGACVCGSLNCNAHTCSSVSLVMLLGCCGWVLQSAPLIAGVGVAAAALLSRELVKQYVKFKAAPAAARAFYKVNDVAVAASMDGSPQNVFPKCRGTLVATLVDCWFGTAL